jgi:limonene-1,2-epoxide hydrolase
MSQVNVEIVERVLAAMSEDDTETAFALVDPDVVIGTPLLSRSTGGLRTREVAGSKPAPPMHRISKVRAYSARRGLRQMSRSRPAG